MGEYRMACFKVALSRLGRDLFHSKSESCNSRKRGSTHSALNACTFSTSSEIFSIDSPVTIRTSASFVASPPSVSMLLFGSAWSRVMTGGSAESARNRSLEDLRTRRSL